MIIKKIVSCTLAIACFVCLYGCGETTATSTAVEISESTSIPTATQEVTQTHAFRYPNQFTSAAPYLPTSDGLYEIKQVFENSASLFYYDFNTMQQVFLCEKPECTHNNESCTSYIPLTDAFPPGLLFAGNQILLVKEVATESGNASIMIMDKNAGNRRVLIELESNEKMGRDFIADDEALYFILETINLEQAQNNCLVRLDLQSGELETLTELPYGLALLSFGKNSLFFDKMGDKIEIYRFDVQNPAEPERTFTWDPNAYGCMVVNGLAYILNYEDQFMSVRNFETDEERSFKINIDPNNARPSFLYSYGEKIMFETYLTDDAGQLITEAELIDTQAQTITPHTLRMEYNNDTLMVYGEYGDYLCVLKDLKDYTWYVTNEDGTQEEVFDLVREYALISKADFDASIPNYLTFELVNG